MGSGIAAHLANCGFRVTLFDMTRDAARAGLDRAKSLKPPHFATPESAARVEIAGVDQDLEILRSADWVCEAIIEKLDAKRSLYERIEPYLPETAMVSTNTSGLEIALLKDGRSETFRRRFFGTHFFNPPRHLKLLELIPTDETDTGELRRATELLEARMGRRVVPAKDTPGFIANRFGMWAMLHAVHVAEKLRLSVETVDLLTGPFLGRPRTASFRLNDLVGIDIMADIAANLRDRCATDDFTPSLSLPKSVEHLLANGHLGQKAGRGYFMKEANSISTLDLETLLYRDSVEADLPSIKPLQKLPLGERLAKTLELGDDAGEFMRRYLIPTLKYAHAIREEISHNVQDFDRVMMWGFGWEMGPFAMIDAIGPEKVGIEGGHFYRQNEMRGHHGGWVNQKHEPEFRSLAEYPLKEKLETFQVRDLGDGIAAVSLMTKLGTVGPKLLEELTHWIGAHKGPFVIANEQRSFSVGFDLTFFRDCIDAGDWGLVDEGLVALQQTAMALRSRACVAAVHGYCLGGGFELALGSAVILASPEATIGFPEAKVGLIPGGHGTALLRARSGDSAKTMVDFASRVVQGVTVSGAYEAQRLGLLRPHDVVGLHPDRLMADAREIAKTVKPLGEQSFEMPVGPLGGMIDHMLAELLAAGKISEYDKRIGEHIKAVFVKPTNWQEALDWERKEFIELMQLGQSVARIRHMIETGKPLRN